MNFLNPSYTTHCSHPQEYARRISPVRKHEGPWKELTIPTRVLKIYSQYARVLVGYLWYCCADTPRNIPRPFTIGQRWRSTGTRDRWEVGDHVILAVSKCVSRANVMGKMWCLRLYFWYINKSLFYSDVNTMYSYVEL